VICETYSCCSQLELSLREIKPSIIVMYEPILEFMREIEIYNAEREPHEELLNLYLLSFKHSSEVQDIEAAIEQEKTSFQ